MVSRTSGLTTVRLLGLVAALALALTACGGDGKPAPGAAGNTGGPDRADQLTIAIKGDEGTLTPYTQVTGYPGTNLSSLVFDTLLRLDENNQVVPLLATGVTANADNTAFTLPLRSGVTWQDGKPFSGEDVRFSVDYYQNNAISDSAPEVADIDRVDVGADQVVIRLSKPDPEFPLRVLADMRILPKHIWSTVKDPTTVTQEQAVGTGPYRLTAYQKDRSYTLEANPDYVMGEPKIKTIRITVIPEEQTAVAALRTGEVDMIASTLQANVARQVKNQRGLTVATGPDFASTLLAMNNGRAPLDRPEVRSAIAMAIDTKDLVGTVLLGQGTVGSPGFVHPKAPGADTSLEPMSSPQMAASQLDKLGAKPGADGVRVLDGKPMRFELLAQSEVPARVRAAQLIADSLDRIGIKVKVTAIDFNTVAERAWPGFDVSKGRDYDMAMWGWSAPVQYDTTKVASLVYSNTDLGRLNITGTKDADMDRLSQQIFAATTMEQRAQASGQLQGLIAERAPFVTLYYANGAYAYRNEVFDDWVYQKGAGILNRMSLVDFTA